MAIGDTGSTSDKIGCIIAGIYMAIGLINFLFRITEDIGFYSGWSLVGRIFVDLFWEFALWPHIFFV